MYILHILHVHVGPDHSLITLIHKQHIDKINTKYNINISEIETKKMSKKWKQEYLKLKILKTTKKNRNRG